MSQESNVRKSPDGWRRYEDGLIRRKGRARASHTAGKPVSKRIDVPEVPPSVRPKLKQRRRVQID